MDYNHQDFRKHSSDKILDDLDNLPDPDTLAADIIENPQSAQESFQELQAQLKKNSD